MIELALPELVRKDVSGIIFFTDEYLFASTGTRIAFTARYGGYSSGEFSSLNLGSHVDDDPDVVLRNREAALRAIGAPESTNLICPNQIHGDHVCLVSTSEGKGFEASCDEASDGCDSLVVTCKDVCAMLCYADCAPVILVAPNGYFAVAHAGWRGVVARIADKTLQRLCKASGVAPSSINAYIGPYIHEECFEVGQDTYEIFEKEFSAGSTAVCKGGDHVSLGAALSITLQEGGVSKDRICDLNICTVCNSDDFFSYRDSGGRCGRHSAMAFRR